ncbi:hypothetical protein [Succinivibrio dextrinosolvens]|uniref:hypothetical protein n=1 Tax=Succinivibrio dextrinosolvens TaxID=83771 RepID=UPI002479C908|nr:hypothetical protein [Succinivibrio dextrinosolvens]
MKAFYCLILILCINVSSAASTFEQLKKACELEDDISCFEFANLAYQQQKRGYYKDAYNSLVKSCELNNQKGCYAAFYFGYNGELGIKTNDKTFLGYGKKGCELKHNESCLGIGAYYLEKKEYSNAITYLKQACDLESGKGCMLLSAYYLQNKHDYQSFEKYAVLGCNLGDATSCIMMSNSKKTGLTGKPNIVESMKYLKKGCLVDYERHYDGECSSVLLDNRD